MPDLPQVVVPNLLFHGVLSGLIAAATWHALNIATHFLKKARPTRD